MAKFKVGDVVHKKRSYPFPGIVIGVMTKLDGQIRYGVECTSPDCKGMIHIFSDKDLELGEKSNGKS